MSSYPTIRRSGCFTSTPIYRYTLYARGLYAADPNAHVIAHRRCPTMVRRGHPYAWGARRAPHGRSARIARPCTALSPPTISRATPCVRAAPPGAPPAEDARPPPRTIVAWMVGVSRNTRGAPAPVRAAHPARPRPPRRCGDTDSAPLVGSRTWIGRTSAL